MELRIAENLRMLRQKFGYTLEGVAEIIGVSRQSVAKWEAGESSPDVLNCVRLATLFKVTLDELITLDLTDLMTRKDSDGDKLMGTITVDPEGRIKLPDQAMEMFGIVPGGKILLLADKHQGMAIVNCSQLD